MSNQQNQPTNQEVLAYRNLMAEHRPCVWCEDKIYQYTPLHGYTELSKVYCCKCGRRVD